MTFETWFGLIGLIASVCTILAAMNRQGRQLRTEITGLRIELKADIADVREEVRGIRVELGRTNSRIDALYERELRRADRSLA